MRSQGQLCLVRRIQHGNRTVAFLELSVKLYTFADAVNRGRNSAAAHWSRNRVQSCDSAIFSPIRILLNAAGASAQRQSDVVPLRLIFSKPDQRRRFNDWRVITKAPSNRVYVLCSRSQN